MKKQSSKDISKNYAKALWDSASDAKNVDAVYKDLKNLTDTFNRLPFLKDLNSPLMNTGQKDELIGIIAQKLKIQSVTQNFLHILGSNRHFDAVFDVFEDFEDLYFKDKGILKILVETVKPLTETQELKLKQGLQKKLKKDIVLSYKLNENLLGGLILYYDSVQIDDSIASKLKTMNKMMKGLK